MELVSEWAIFLAISLSELLFWQQNGAKYSESEIKKDNLFNLENSVILCYTRNIVQLNSFYIKFDSKHFYLYNKYYN